MAARDLAIEVDRLGKLFVLAGKRVRAHEAIERTVRKTLGLRLPPERDSFWALKDCSFAIGRGEVVGILGQNGAGKSILLKMLSRVVKPTTGSAVLRGRLVSLLELGTGFDPNMTGRENVFLNGAILGMRQARMAAKFDEIVDFAGISRFIDEPAKHYSSGMYSRLAFSVASHVEADVLLIDEVLSVGDAAFQQQCLARIQQVAAGGATILFVSHSLDLVKQLCTRGIVIEKGQVVFDGCSEAAIERYSGKKEED
jgi:lipopolysaccharide transport system ATP-binding protein